MRLVTWAGIGRLVGGFGSATLFLLWNWYFRPPGGQQFVGLLLVAFVGLVGLAGATVGGLVGWWLGRSGTRA